MAVDVFEGSILGSTSKAVEFQSVYWEGGVWFPKSQVEIEEDGDMTIVLKVKDWLTRKRGILEFTHYGQKEIEEIART